MNEISGKTWNEGLNKLFLVKNSAQRNLYWTEYDVEIENLERRNSVHASIESRRELESRRRHFLEANQWADQAQRERIHLSSELETKNRLHQECYARSCQEIEDLKRRCCKEAKWSNSYSMQHDQESRTVSLLRDQIRKLQERLEFIEIFQDPDSPSSFLAVPTFHIKLSSPRVPKSLAGDRECSETHERIWYSRKRFWLSTCPTSAWRNTKWFTNLATSSEIQRREGIEKSGS